MTMQVHAVIEAEPAAHGQLDQAALIAAARRFTVPALLRVLRHHGYAAEDIWFESVRGAPRAPGVIDGVRFDPAANRVIVRLTTGLLGADGPLPSYFQQFTDGLGDPRPFLAFVRFFDHVVATNHAYVAHPADGVARGSPLARAYQVIAGVRSPARLHAVLRALIPELALDIMPAVLAHRAANPPARLGTARLDGTALVGPSHLHTQHGWVARLHAEATANARGHSWADIVRERCARVLPALVRGAPQLIEIRLRIAQHTGRARLGRTHALGRMPVTSGEPQAWEISVLRLGGQGTAP
jgi:predicted component of type VI protein secretion system